jgi:hypothetical protein
MQTRRKPERIAYPHRSEGLFCEQHASMWEKIKLATREQDKKQQEYLESLIQDHPIEMEREQVQA